METTLTTTKKRPGKAAKFFKTFLRLFRTNRLFAIGITMCAMWMLIAIFAEVIIPYDPVSQNLASRFQPPVSYTHLTLPTT